MTTILIVVLVVVVLALIAALMVVDQQKQDLDTAKKHRGAARLRDSAKSEKIARLNEKVAECWSALGEWETDAEAREEYIRQLVRQRDGAYAAYHAAYEAFCHQADLDEQRAIDRGPIYADVISGEQLIVDRPGSLNEVLSDLKEPAPLAMDLSVTGSFTATDALSLKRRLALAEQDRKLEAAR